MRNYFSLLLSLFICHISVAQIKDFQESWVNKKFPFIGVEDIAHSKIDISDRSFIRFGMKYCEPCTYEFPYFIEAAKMFPDIQFVYISTDSVLINYLLDKGEKPSNLYTCYIDSKIVESLKLTFGYPTNYFIKNGIIKQVIIGGATTEDGAEKDLKKWEAILQEID